MLKYKYIIILIFLTLLIVLFYFKNILFYINTQVSDMPNKTNKVVVFDLDETLGSFGDLYILWSGITQLHPQFTQFEQLMDLYPEFLRYGILTILEFLYEKKKTKECSKIFIYTNNRCSKEWVQNICSYFQTKIHALQPKGDILIPLFNTLICAFKIKNKHCKFIEKFFI